MPLTGHARLRAIAPRNTGLHEKASIDRTQRRAADHRRRYGRHRSNNAGDIAHLAADAGPRRARCAAKSARSEPRGRNEPDERDGPVTVAEPVVDLVRPEPLEGLARRGLALGERLSDDALLLDHVGSRIAFRGARAVGAADVAAGRRTSGETFLDAPA